MNLKSFLLTAVLALTAVTAHGQKARERKAEMNEALTYANSIAFMYLGAGSKSSEDHAFVFFTGDNLALQPSLQQKRPLSKEMVWVWFSTSDIVKRYDQFGARAFSLFAGNYLLRVPRQGGKAVTTRDGVEFEYETWDFNFEAGKCYSMYSNVDQNNEIEFSISETVETEAAFKSYMDAYPRLNGVWRGEKRANTIKYTMKYTIEGERMIFEGTSRNKTLIAEGRILYNENTIVFIPETANANGKQLEDYSGRPAYVWYYTLDEGGLHLDSKKMQSGTSVFTSGLTYWENDGEFHKTN